MIKDSLDTIALRVNMVIKLGKIKKCDYANLMKKIKGYMTSFDNEIEWFAMILHDKDTTKVVQNDGTIKDAKKIDHIHLLFKYKKGKRVRLSTTLNRISNYLQLEPTYFEIDSIKNEIGAIQYLIHKNDSDKYQYHPSEIIHNLQDGVLENTLSLNGDTISACQLATIVKLACGNRYEIMKRIGLSMYKNYRMCISDLIELYEKRSLDI